MKLIKIVSGSLLTAWSVSAVQAALLPYGEPVRLQIPNNKTAFSTGGGTTLFSPAAASEVPLVYDSGPALYFPQPALAGSCWSVRFSPLQSCSLVSISMVSAGGSGSAWLHVLADSAGFPSRDLITPFTVNLSGSSDGLSIQTVLLPVPINLEGMDFHIALEMQNSGAPYLTGDADGGKGRSCYRQAGGSWISFTETDLVMRASVRYYGPDVIPPQMEHTPLDAAFSEDENIEVEAGITDYSGISKAAIYYSVNGGECGSVPMSKTTKGFLGRIPAQPEGTTLRYFIEAEDGSATHNPAWLPASGFQNPYTLPVFGGHQVKYDDGTAESFFIVDERYDGNRFAVRLTPSVYPAQINMLRVFVNDTAGILLSVYSDSGGRPGRLLSGPYLTRSDVPGAGWVNFNLPPGSQPLITSGNFFVVAQWLSASPQTPGIGADGDFPDGRSFFFTETFGWKSWVYDDWMMRAAYTVSKSAQNRPTGYFLGQNFPNPFNPSTEIRFRLPEESPVEISVYNIVGQKIKTLTSGVFPAGEHSIVWDGRDEWGRALSSGVYFYRLTAQKYIETRKMVLIK